MANYVTKTWADRVSEFPTRRILTKEDASTEVVTVERSEGTVSVEGDPWKASEMNAMEGRIEDGFDRLGDTFEFAVATGDWTSETGGYYATKTLTGATSADVPHVSLRSATNYPTDDENADAALIVSVEADTDEVTFHATAIPSATVNLEVRLQVVIWLQ